MRTRSRFGLSILIAALVVSAQIADAAGIHAEKGKHYKLTKAHGPWMIMVCSFQEPPPEAKTKGMSPQEAAHELVYELRLYGIPAYAFEQKDEYDELDTIGRQQSNETRKYRSHHGGICVLAGNFTSPEQDDAQGDAQETLEFVKKFRPKVLSGVEKQSGLVHKLKNGGIYRVTRDQPDPLGGAFLTTNPMLTPEEIRQRRRDPLLLQLNSGAEYSVLENDGKFTLIVASFYGKGMTKVADSGFDEFVAKFTVSDSLNQAAVSAMELCKAMRARDIEAYVYHDRYSSVVTIGAFATPTDPAIAKYQQMFGSKMVRHPTTGQMVQTAESFTIPKNIPPGGTPEKSWIFDPQPRLMEVPHLGTR